MADLGQKTLLSKYPDQPLKTKSGGNGQRFQLFPFVSDYPRTTQKTVPISTTYPKVP